MAGPYVLNTLWLIHDLKDIDIVFPLINASPGVDNRKIPLNVSGRTCNSTSCRALHHLWPHWKKGERDLTGIEDKQCYFDKHMFTNKCGWLAYR